MCSATRCPRQWEVLTVLQVLLREKFWLRADLAGKHHCQIACNAWSLCMPILVCVHPGMHPRLFVSWVPVWLLPPFCQEVIDLAMRCGHSWQWTVGANLVGRMRTDLWCYSVMFEAVEAVEAFPEAIAFCFWMEPSQRENHKKVIEHKLQMGLYSRSKMAKGSKGWAQECQAGLISALSGTPGTGENQKKPQRILYALPTNVRELSTWYI